MSSLGFSGSAHELQFLDLNGKVSDCFPAYNNIDSHATLLHLPNGTFVIQDTRMPHMHPANPNGPYGSHGIIRFTVPGHLGIGVHSGRANASHLPGPEHPTMGCIRTTDEAMGKITGWIRSDPLTTITISSNNRAVAASASLRNSNVAMLLKASP